MGSLEGQKIPMLMVQMLCCLISSDAIGTPIVPREIKWYRDHITWINPEKAISIYEVVIRSGILLLDLQFNLRRTSWHKESMKALYQCIHSTQFYFMMLWEIKQELLRSKKAYSGYKYHVIEHCVDDIIAYGPMGQYSMIM